jgi:hypothetical protein
MEAMGVETLARNLGLGGAAFGAEGRLRRIRAPRPLATGRVSPRPEFSGELPPVLGQVRTVHWFDPCALLTNDARSEYRLEFRERQPGGGWQLKGCGVRKNAD